MGLNLSPHEYAVHPDTQQPVLTRVNAYVRIREGMDPPMVLQAGRVYGEGGDFVPEESWPTWLPGAILKLNPKIQEECGFQGYVQNLNKSGAVIQSPLAPPQEAPAPRREPGYPLITPRPAPIAR